MNRGNGVLESYETDFGGKNKFNQTETPIW